MNSTRILMPALLAALSLSACTDKKALSEKEAADEVVKLLPVVKEDVDQVRKGLPEGAKKLGALLEADPGANPASLQKAITTARSQVRELDVAKSTFFSFLDPSGVVLRSEADPDLLAGKNVFTTFPALKKSADAASGIVEVFGEMPEMRGVKNGADLAWAVAHPVKDGEGKVKGEFLTGWSFRRFAYHLEEAAKRDLLETTQKEEKKQVPIVYVFALKGGKAYGAPVTPDVNEEAIEGLNLIEKTAGGLFKTSVEVTGRTFGVAAQRVPELAADAGIAVMLSEI